MEAGAVDLEGTLKHYPSMNGLGKPKLTWS